MKAFLATLAHATLAAEPAIASGTAPARGTETLPPVAQRAPDAPTDTLS